MNGGGHAQRASIPPSLEGGGQGVGGACATGSVPTTLHRIKPVMRKHAADLRREATQPERALWYWLRNRRLDALKFRRQATLGNCIVDFLCPELKLVIEIDGESHVGRGEQDRSRDACLIEQGLSRVACDQR
jgi:very-short-patch-repair endonuclease